MGGPQTLSEKVSEVKETRQTSIRTPTSCSDISKKKMLTGQINNSGKSIELVKININMRTIQREIILLAVSSP